MDVSEEMVDSVSLCLCLCLVPLLLSLPVSGLTEVYRWPGGRPQVAWPNNTWAELYSGLELTVIGIKVWADHIYLTAPRWNGNRL